LTHVTHSKMLEKRRKKKRAQKDRAREFKLAKKQANKSAKLRAK